MKNQIMANLKDLLKTHKFFYEVEIKRTSFFTFNGYMDWLIGNHIIALEEKLTENRFKLRFPKFIVYNIIHNPILYRKWPFKYRNRIIIPAIYEDRFELYENIDSKFKDLSIPNIKYLNKDNWFLRDNEIKIIKEINLDLNLNLNLNYEEKVFIKKIIQKY